jgi:outer membrane murein-binding lipoprotein Lpp
VPVPLGAEDDPNAPAGEGIRKTTTGVMLAAMDRVEKGEKKVFLGTLVNGALVLATLGLSGGFAAWVLESSKSYAQTVDQRVDKLEQRVDAQNEQVQKKLDRTEEKVDAVKDQLTEVKILLVKLADGGQKPK